MQSHGSETIEYATSTVETMVYDDIDAALADWDVYYDMSRIRTHLAIAVREIAERGILDQITETVDNIACNCKGDMLKR